MSDLELDVRPILRNGGEPFGAIMEAVGQLAPGQRLRLLAPFRPEPLFGVMAGKGFAYEAAPLEGNDWEVIFVPGPEAVSAPEMRRRNPESWADPTYYLDLAELDPPEPMVRILTQLESMEDGEVLFALLAREPLLLYPELQNRGHGWAGDFDESGNLYRLMVCAGAGK
ncbi:MAG: universal stress protein [Pelagibacterium sp. SCN 63-23]|nr:MAG: universal stress protein [Pelagibacterium sp. SCN 63-23]